MKSNLKATTYLRRWAQPLFRKMTFSSGIFGSQFKIATLALTTGTVCLKSRLGRMNFGIADQTKLSLSFEDLPKTMVTMDLWLILILTPRLNKSGSRKENKTASKSLMMI